MKDFGHYEIPVPPTLTEQKAIATALSDVDALIAKFGADHHQKESHQTRGDAATTHPTA